MKWLCGKLQLFSTPHGDTLPGLCLCQTRLVSVFPCCSRPRLTVSPSPSGNGCTRTYIYADALCTLLRPREVLQGTADEVSRAQRPTITSSLATLCLAPLGSDTSG